MQLNTKQAREEYWARQVELIRILGLLGFGLQLTDRIPTFWFRLRLKDIGDPPNDELVEEAIQLLDEIVELRRRGYEPPHDGKRYT